MAARMSDHTHLAAAIEQAELEAAITARRHDLAQGLVPNGVHRALYRHELAARTSFAGIADDTVTIAAAIARQLAEDRGRFIDLVAADLAIHAAQATPTAPTTRVAERALDLAGPDGLTAIPGVDTLLAESARTYRGLLERGLQTAARRLAGEAEQQGVTIGDTLKLDPAIEDQLALVARRLAEAPQADVARALAVQALVGPRDFVAPDELIRNLAGHAQQLADSVLRQYASDAAAQASGLGRQAAVASAQRTPVAVYASEILDQNTCGPCSLVDGKQYADLDTARVDYPNGIYVHCEGGSRCRGTLVVVWSDETPPSLDQPGL